MPAKRPNQPQSTKVKMSPSIQWNCKSTGTTGTLSWPGEPQRGSLVLRLPPPRLIRPEELKDLMDKFVAAIHAALNGQPVRKIETANVIVQFRARKLDSFSTDDLNYFLEKLEYWFGPWTRMEVEKGDIAQDYVE